MKKIMVLLVFLGAVFLVLGCSAPDAPGADDGKVKVAVSILPLSDFVEKVGGDKVDVIVMIPPGASPATYEPTPSQLKSVSEADVYVKAGSGIPFEDVWMDKIAGMNEDMYVVDCSFGIEIVDNDPHIWLSVRNAQVIVGNIYEGLAKVDGANEEYYSMRKDEYVLELEELDEEIRSVFSAVDDGKILVFHPAWGYFAREYGIEQVPVEVEGKEPSIADVSKLVEFAKDNGIRVVFAQPQFNAKSAEAIARDIGGSVVFVDPLARDYITNLRIVSKSFADNMG